MKVKKLLSLITVVAVMFAGCEDTFEDIDLSKFECLKTLDGHSDEVDFVSFSPDGKYIVSRSSGEPIKIWNAKKGKCIKTLDAGGCIREGDKRSVAYSPDGSKIIYSDNYDTIKIVDANTGNLLKTLKLVLKPEEDYLYIYSIAYSPDGNHIACGSGTYNANTDDHLARLDIFDANTGSCIKTIKMNDFGFMSSIAYSPDGNYIVFSYSKIKIFDANTGNIVKTINSSGRYLSYSPDGNNIICYLGNYLEGNTNIWNAYTGECIKTFETKMPISLSPDGKHLAYHAGSGIIEILDINTGECVKTLGEYSYNDIRSISYSPDGTKIVSGSEDGTIRIWGED